MKKFFNSIRAKLFCTLCIVIVMIIGFLVIVNSVFLETLYVYSKKESSLETFEYIKANYSKEISDELKKYKTHTEIITALKSIEYIYHIEEM